LLLPLLLLGAGFCIWSLFANVALGEAFIPVPLGSDAVANYGKDEIPGRLRSLSISIIEAVIRDRDPEAEDAGARATDVSESLKSPVPTVTPKPGDPTRTPTPTVIPELTVTGTTALTVTPLPLPNRTSTATEVPAAGPTSTSGPSPLPSKTPTPSATAAATNTSTVTPTPTPSNTPTSTPSPTPTQTPTSTSTPTPTVTSTSTPTNTPPPSCSSITLTSFNKSGQDASWTLTNGAVPTIKITQIDLSVPGSPDLDEVKLQGKKIWDGDLTPPLTINSGWIGSSADRQLSPGTSKTFKLVFESSSHSSGYTLDVTFDSGCVISFSN